MANAKKMDKVEAINFTNTETNRKYILDFSLDSVAFLQERGFDWDELEKKSATMIPLIWWGAFRRYQPNVSKVDADKMLEEMGGMSVDIIIRLRQLWEQALSCLVATDDKSKNSKWEISL